MQNISQNFTHCKEIFQQSKFLINANSSFLGASTTLSWKKVKMEKEKEMEKVQNRPAALALELNMLGRTYGGQALVGERDNNFSFE